MHWGPAGYGAALAPDLYEVGDTGRRLCGHKAEPAVWMGMATKALLIKNPEKDIDKAC